MPKRRGDLIMGARKLANLFFHPLWESYFTLEVMIFYKLWNAWALRWFITWSKWAAWCQESWAMFCLRQVVSNLANGHSKMLFARYVRRRRQFWTRFIWMRIMVYRRFPVLIRTPCPWVIIVLFNDYSHKLHLTTLSCKSWEENPIFRSVPSLSGNILLNNTLHETWLNELFGAKQRVSLFPLWRRVLCLYCEHHAWIFRWMQCDLTLRILTKPWESRLISSSKVISSACFIVFQTPNSPPSGKRVLSHPHDDSFKKRWKEQKSPPKSWTNENNPMSKINTSNETCHNNDDQSKILQPV